MEPYLTIMFFLFIMSLCIGSFLNVVILRAFSGESIVLPPSKCPKCHEKLKWYDNIPVLSFIILRGKCRYCKEPISPQYPLVEMTTAILFMIVMHKYGINPQSILLLIITALSIVISVTDIKEKVVFDPHVFTLIGAGLVYNIINHNIITSLIGLAVGAVIMELLARLGYLFVQKRAFGEGDTLIAAGIGAILGPKLFLLALALSLFIQAISVLPPFMKKLWNTNQKTLALSITAFIIVSAVYKILSKTASVSSIVDLIFIASIFVLGIYSCVKLLKSCKQDTNFLYFPFGPSLLAANFIVLIYGKELIKLLTSL